jgi:hypothetical protein
MPTPPPAANARRASKSPEFLDEAAVTAQPRTTAAPVAASIFSLSSPYSLRPSARIAARCSAVILMNALGRSSSASEPTSPRRSRHGKETQWRRSPVSESGAANRAWSASAAAASAMLEPSEQLSSTSSRNHSPPASGAIQIAAGQPRSGDANETSSTSPRLKRGEE